MNTPERTRTRTCTCTCTRICICAWPALLLAILLGGCMSAAPQYDSQFGQAVRQNRQAQVLDPDAGQREELAEGLDGRSAQEAVRRYQDSFKAPPPAGNVIHIGAGTTGR